MKKIFQWRIPKVSIIVPAFNSYKTLERCLDSVMHQTLKNIEIICVNDGSTDDSGKIIIACKKRDSRIRRIQHINNLGEGAARNTGLDNATGKFVFHLDADDSIPKTAIEDLYLAAVFHSSQLVKGGFSIFGSDGSLRAENTESAEKKVVNTNIYKSAFLRKIPVSHCSYLYDRELVQNHGIRYRTDLSVGLDLIWLTQTLIAANRVTVLESSVYNYHLRSDSATQSILSLKQAYDALEAKRVISQLLIDVDLVNEARSVLTGWNYQVKSFWTPVSVKENRLIFFEFFKQFNELIPDDLVPWNQVTPFRHRILLALVILVQYDIALDYLEFLQEVDPGKLEKNVKSNFESLLGHTVSKVYLRSSVRSLADKTRWGSPASHFSQKF
ncbi:MAG: glycosyltransferase family 2 protein [Halioglobus sp.]